jgi:hypothetical protein
MIQVLFESCVGAPRRRDLHISDALNYLSFPRKRESILLIPLDSRFRGNDA